MSSPSSKATPGSAAGDGTPTGALPTRRRIVELAREDRPRLDSELSDLSVEDVRVEGFGGDSSVEDGDVEEVMPVPLTRDSREAVDVTPRPAQGGGVSSNDASPGDTHGSRKATPATSQQGGSEQGDGDGAAAPSPDPRTPARALNFDTAPTT